MVVTPQAVIIEDSAAHQFMAATLLQDVGFTTVAYPSLVHGYHQIQALLAPEAPAVPTIILVDLKLPAPYCADLEGIALISVLAQAMHDGALRPAHMVAITSEPTEQRCREAMLAGSRAFLAKPFTAAHAQMLRDLVVQPIATTVRDAYIAPSHEQMLHRMSTQLLQTVAHLGEDAVTVMSEPLVIPHVEWDAQRVEALLFSPTALLREEPWCAWVHAHGGLSAVYARLRALPLPADLASLLAHVVQHHQSWRTMLDHLYLSKSSYYRRRKALIAFLCIRLNTDEW